MNLKTSLLYLLVVFAVALANEPIVEVVVVKTNLQVIGETSASVWEPVPPDNDSYVLGQFAHNSGSYPPLSTELFVARSVNKSLAEPLDFYGPWVILDTIALWMMKCPTGYVSLGSIASRLQRQGPRRKPDTSKYRCVVWEATVTAKLADLLYQGNAGFKIYGSVVSSEGWQNPFFNFAYSSQKIVYAIKKDAVITKTDLQNSNIPTPSSTTQSRTTTITPTTTAPEGQQQSLDTGPGLKVAIGVLVCVGLLSLMVLACCIWHKKHIIKIAPSSANNTNTTTTTVNNESEYEVVRSLGSNLHLYGNPEAELRDNVLYEPHRDNREMKPNILYHGIDEGDCDYAFATDVRTCQVPEAYESQSSPPNYQNVNLYATPSQV